MLRSAMALRAEENQVFGAASFLLGPNYLNPENAQDFFGRSAVLAPISLTGKGDGVLIQAGSIRTEAVVGAELNAQELDTLREKGRFRPRSAMNLARMEGVLAEWYQRGMTIEEGVEAEIAGPTGSVEEPAPFERVFPPDPEADESEESLEANPEAEVPDAETDEPAETDPDKSEAPYVEVPEALSLTSSEEEQDWLE
jgi:hypothetical protein